MRPIGVQLYSVRGQLSDDRDGVLRRLAGIGYQSVEPARPLDSPAGFRAVADDLGLAVPTVHAAVLDGRREEYADAASTLGARSLVVPRIAPERFADAAGVRRAAQQLTDAASWAAARGLSVGYHNHWWEFTEIAGAGRAFDLLVSEVSPDVFFEVDVYWAATAGVDVPALLARLGNRARYLHVKDGPARLGEPMTEVGAGTLPMREILAAAPPNTGLIVELDDCATDVMAALAASLAYLREAL